MQPKQISNGRSSGPTATLVAILCASLMFAWTLPAVAGTVATAVLGQGTFTTNTANGPDAASLSTATSAITTAVDKANNDLYVVDINNSRVLGFNIATLASDGPADLVIGQPDFFTTGCNTQINGAANICNPRGVALDSNGNLYIADGGNNRVLVFSNPFKTKTNTGRTAGFSAFMVFGQAGDFTSTQCNVEGSQPSASTLCLPIGVALDSANNLYVADTSNNRVLEYSNPVATNNLSASVVIGQANFTGNAANQGGSAGGKTLNGPQAVAVDSNNNLYVADSSNNRVLEYNSGFGTDATANQVWGQGGSFTLNGCNQGSASAITLCTPDGVALDGSNNLYIADTGNHRVLEYNETTNPPANRTANLAFGQPNTTTFNGCNQGTTPSKTSLCDPTGLAVDSANDVFIADVANNRVLDFNEASSPPTNASANLVLGQEDFAHNAPNSIDPTSLNTPVQAALDTSAAPNHLYLADFNNSRVLGWRTATFATGTPADLVIGQLDFQSGACNRNIAVNGTTLCTPVGVAADSSGNLYVADTGNARVVEYTDPFATCAGFPCVFGGTANKVFGQPNANTGGCNTGGSPSASTLCNATRVALDSFGNLYVADQSNNRVLEFNTPLTVTSVKGSGDTTADLVFGQGGSFTTNSSNNGGVSSTSLSNPDAVAIDSSSNVYIADFSNSRVLEYNETTTATTAPSNVTANTVFGQFSSFTVNSCNNDGVSANSLCDPIGLSLDSSNDLFVADEANDRMLEFFTPLTVTAVQGSGDTTADIVWGQGGSFESNSANLGGTRPSAATLARSQDVVVDGAGNVFISDTNNNRVLLFAPPFVPPGAQVVVPAPPDPLRVRPAQLAFATTVVGAKSRAQKLTLKNLGEVPLRIGGISSATSEFALGGTCAAVLPARASCTVTVTFEPVAIGRRAGQLLIKDDKGRGQAVELTGRGKPRAHSR